MKKSIIILSSFGLLFLLSCMSSSFVYTGNYHEPLPENTYVKIVIDNVQNLSYEEIGVIEVEESFGNPNLDEIVERARFEARKKGADCIILLNTTTRIDGTSDAITSKMYYLFKAVKLK